ncbi:MAG: GxxExxY protein [Bacteroidota bacterium]|nr:GxxExxY protein [Bacteroidota bacterium]
MHINELTGIVVDVSIKIHSKIGPGCFERVYEELLYYELVKRGLKACRQVYLPIDYEELHIEKAYKLDLLIEDMLIIELESAESPATCFIRPGENTPGIIKPQVWNVAKL